MVFSIVRFSLVGDQIFWDIIVRGFYPVLTLRIFCFTPFVSPILCYTALDHHASSEAGECALVVTGAYDRRLRLWDVTSATVAAAGGRAKMLGTLSSKVCQAVMRASRHKSVFILCNDSYSKYEVTDGLHSRWVFK